MDLHALITDHGWLIACYVICTPLVALWIWLDSTQDEDHP